MGSDSFTLTAVSGWDENVTANARGATTVGVTPAVELGGEQAGRGQTLFLQDELQLLALDDREAARKLVVVRECGVDVITGGIAHLVVEPPACFRVVLEVPECHADLGLIGVRRRQRDGGKCNDGCREKLPHETPRRSAERRTLVWDYRYVGDLMSTR